MAAVQAIAAPGPASGTAEDRFAPGGGGQAPGEWHALMLRARVLARFAHSGELAEFGCPEVLARALRVSHWGDSPEAAAARETWPRMLRRAPSDWVTSAALVMGVNEAVMASAIAAGFVCFAEVGGAPSVVLRSDCGRRSEAWRLDGAPFLTPAGFVSAMVFPGSLPAVPYGMRTVGNATRCVAITGPSSACLPLLAAVLSAGLVESGLLCVSAPDFVLCRELVDALAGLRVRLFFPETEAWEDAEERLADSLEAAGAEVDCFAFGAFGVRDVAGFSALPAREVEEVELLPA